MAMSIDADDSLKFVVIGIIPILMAFSIQFIALRIRETRAMPRDPQVGRKAALFLFFNLAIFLLLFGLTLSSLDLTEYLFEPAVTAQAVRQTPPTSMPTQPALIPEVDPTIPVPAGATTPPPAPLPASVVAPPAPPPPRDWFNDQQRMAAAYVVCGLAYVLLFGVLIRYATNSRDFPSVRRAFAGARFVLIGLVVMTLATTSVVFLFQSGETDLKVIQKQVALTVVWGPAAVIHLIGLLFGKSTIRPPE
jgi:hypothetical protein